MNKDLSYDIGAATRDSDLRWAVMAFISGAAVFQQAAQDRAGFTELKETAARILLGLHEAAEGHND